MTPLNYILPDLLKDYKKSYNLMESLDGIVTSDADAANVMAQIRGLPELNERRYKRLKSRLECFFSVYAAMTNDGMIPNTSVWQIEAPQRTPLAEIMAYAVWRYREQSRRKRPEDIVALMTILQSPKSELEKKSEIQFHLLSMKTGLFGRSKLRDHCLNMLKTYEPAVNPAMNPVVNLVPNIPNNNEAALHQEITELKTALEGQIQVMKTLERSHTAIVTELEGQKAALERKDQEIAELTEKNSDLADKVSTLSALTQRMKQALDKAKGLISIFAGSTTKRERADAKAPYFDSVHKTLIPGSLREFDFEIPMRDHVVTDDWSQSQRKANPSTPPASPAPTLLPKTATNSPPPPPMPKFKPSTPPPKLTRKGSLSKQAQAPSPENAEKPADPLVEAIKKFHKNKEMQSLEQPKPKQVTPSVPKKSEPPLFKFKLRSSQRKIPLVPVANEDQESHVLVEQKKPIDWENFQPNKTLPEPTSLHKSADQLTSKLKKSQRFEPTEDDSDEFTDTASKKIF